MIEIIATVEEIDRGRKYMGDITVGNASYGYVMRFTLPIEHFLNGGKPEDLREMPLYTERKLSPEEAAFFAMVAGSSAIHYYTNPDNMEEEGLITRLLDRLFFVEKGVEYSYTLPESMVPESLRE